MPRIYRLPVYLTFYFVLFHWGLHQLIHDYQFLPSSEAASAAGCLCLWIVVKLPLQMDHWQNFLRTISKNSNVIFYEYGDGIYTFYSYRLKPEWDHQFFTLTTYGTGMDPVCPREFRAVHHCSSSLDTIVIISPFRKGKSSGSYNSKVKHSVFLNILIKLFYIRILNIY